MRSRGARARCCSRRAPAAARRRCSWSASCGRCWTTACDPGQILAITFTEKAAGELRSRVRARFLALGEREAARETESAWIGTIHGFCTRVLRGHAVAAGLDPAFVVLDDTDRPRAARDGVAARATRAGSTTAATPAVDVAAAYGVDRLEEAIGEVHDALRSAGATVPALPPIPPVAPVAEARARGRSGRSRRRRPSSRPPSRARGSPPRRRPCSPAARFPTYKMEALCGPGCTAYRDAVERLATRRARRARGRGGRAARGPADRLRDRLRRREDRQGRRWTSTTSSSTPATCCATTRRCAPRTRTASRASWSTSSRTRTRSSSSSSTSWRRTARSSSGTSSSRSTASATRTSRSSAAVARRSGSAARPRRCRRTSARGRRSSRR